MDREKFKRLKDYIPKPVPGHPHLLPAAVLVPIFLKEQELHILLTKRTDRLEHHKGQISFPGGAFHYEDLDCLTTALRETEEEIGMEMDAIEVLGELDHTVTLSHFRICPFVGIIPYPYPFKLSAFEVERLIELPLACLLDKSGYKEVSMDYEGQLVNNLSIEYQGDIIWGATARILKNLMDILSFPG